MALGVVGYLGAEYSRIRNVQRHVPFGKSRFLCYTTLNV